MNEYAPYIRAVWSLLFVVGLLLVLFWTARRFNLLQGYAPLPSNKQKRLKVTETLVIDGRRRLIMVQRDHVEHLILISPTSEILIENGISPKVETSPS